MTFPHLQRELMLQPSDSDADVTFPYLRRDVTSQQQQPQPSDSDAEVTLQRGVTLHRLAAKRALSERYVVSDVKRVKVQLHSRGSDDHVALIRSRRASVSRRQSGGGSSANTTPEKQDDAAPPGGSGGEERGAVAVSNLKRRLQQMLKPLVISTPPTPPPTPTTALKSSSQLLPINGQQAEVTAARNVFSALDSPVSPGVTTAEGHVVPTVTTRKALPAFNISKINFSAITYKKGATTTPIVAKVTACGETTTGSAAQCGTGALNVRILEKLCAFERDKLKSGSKSAGVRNIFDMAAVQSCADLAQGYKALVQNTAQVNTEVAHAHIVNSGVSSEFSSEPSGIGKEQVPSDVTNHVLDKPGSDVSDVLRQVASRSSRLVLDKLDTTSLAQAGAVLELSTSTGANGALRVSVSQRRDVENAEDGDERDEGDASPCKKVSLEYS